MLINITIPVYNEERVLPQTIHAVSEFLRRNCSFSHEIIIADNASVDRTLEIAKRLEQELKSLRVLRLHEKGRGRALKKVWAESGADVLSYMDVDLSTDLYAFPTLIEGLVSGGFDLAVGSRLLKPELTDRSIKRELISRSYNLLVKAFFHTRFSDAQCGFKAITKDTMNRLLPWIEDDGWFFDTELLVLAEKLGFRIYDLPVRWVEDLDSRVKIFRTAIEDIKGLIRLKRNLCNGTYRNVARPKLDLAPVNS